MASAVWGTICLRPLRISDTVCTGRPMISANSSPVQPRSSSSSRRYSPGGNASAGVKVVGIFILLSVVVDDLNHDDRLVCFGFLDSHDQTPLLVEPQRPLSKP